MSLLTIIQNFLALHISLSLCCVAGISPLSSSLLALIAGSPRFCSAAATPFVFPLTSCTFSSSLSDWYDRLGGSLSISTSYFAGQSSGSFTAVSMSPGYASAGVGAGSSHCSSYSSALFSDSYVSLPFLALRTRSKIRTMRPTTRTATTVIREAGWRFRPSPKPLQFHGAVVEQFPSSSHVRSGSFLSFQSLRAKVLLVTAPIYRGFSEQVASLQTLNPVSNSNYPASLRSR